MLGWSRPHHQILQDKETEKGSKPVRQKKKKRDEVFLVNVAAKSFSVSFFYTPCKQKNRERTWCPKRTSLHYTTFHYTTWHCTALYFTTLHCTALHYTALQYTTLHWHYTTLRYTTHYNTLDCTTHFTARYNILYCTALHYTTLYCTTLFYQS